MHGFDLYRMFVPDIMHEFDSGVWKSIFIHLLRILSSVKGNKLSELNRRCALLASFIECIDLLVHQVQAGPNFWPG
jgi:hypothetical protein